MMPRPVSFGDSTGLRRQVHGRVQFPVPRGLGRRVWGQGHMGPPCAANQASDRKANKHSDPGSGVGRPACRELNSSTEGVLHGAVERAVLCREPWSGRDGRQAPRARD